MTWHPIETAPKDGTEILVITPFGMAVACWRDDWWTVDDFKHGPFSLRGPAPTHWAELPEPPRD